MIPLSLEGHQHADKHDMFDSNPMITIHTTKTQRDLLYNIYKIRALTRLNTCAPFLAYTTRLYHVI